MGARGRVRGETWRGGPRGRGGGERVRGGGGGGRKLDKLGLYPRARVSRFRPPPGGHRRGDRAARHGGGASPRQRHGGAPQPPAAAAAAASFRQRPGLGGEEGTKEDQAWGGKSPPDPRRTNGRSGTSRPGLPFLSHGLSTSGAHAAAAPGSAPRHSPRRRRRRRALPAPPPPRPPLLRQPQRQPSTRSRTAARRRRQNTYRSAGWGGRGAWTSVCGLRARARGAGRGAPGGAGRRAWSGAGRAGGGEQENMGEVPAREG